jgi:hypothetical protein
METAGMTTYRGMDGFVSLGGYVAGALRVASAVDEGGTQVTLTGTPLLSGVVLAGDTFTVTGVSGTYTSQSTVLAASNSLGPVAFSPAAPAGGFPAGAAVLFASSSVAQTRQWSATPTLQILETTVQGATHRTRRTGLVEWEGTFEALFDYGDPQQASLLDRYTAAKPSGVVAGVSFSVSPDGPVVLYGAAVLTTLAITSPGQELVSVTVTFQSTSQLLAAPIISPTLPILPSSYLEPFDVALGPLNPQYTEPFEPTTAPPLADQYTESFDLAAPA